MGTTFDFAAAAMAVGDDAGKLADLGRMARRAGDPGAYALARRARDLAPDDAGIFALTAAAMVAGVQRWHYNIAADSDRIEAYRAAIERNVKPGDRVLDIGAGTGILAMIAARAGAAHVYSCEGNPPVADLARRIVAANGMADRVTILAKPSTEIDVEAHMGGRVDVIISEILSDDLLAEKVLPYLADAHTRLLREGGRMTPCSGQVVIAPAYWPRVSERVRIDAVGFDLSMITDFDPPLLKVGPERINEVIQRGPAIDLFDVDFALGNHQVPFRKSATLVSDGGPVNGILMWMRFQFDAVSDFETYPLRNGRQSSWAPNFHPLPDPRATEPGDRMQVHAVRDPDLICLWAEPL